MSENTPTPKRSDRWYSKMKLPEKDPSVSLTIKVNLSAANKEEGEAEFSISVRESHLRYINLDSFHSELDKLIIQALAEYTQKNQG